jgi:hypothetical protein
MTIIYAFDHVLTERGFGVNVGHLVFILLKIAVSLWILLTDSDKNECVLKWQAKLMFIISGIAGCLGGGGGDTVDKGGKILCQRHSRQLRQGIYIILTPM